MCEDPTDCVIGVYVFVYACDTILKIKYDFKKDNALWERGSMSMKI